MVRSRTVLMYEFKFRANLLLGVRASYASDLLMVGYLLKLFWEGAPVGATMMMRQPSSVGFQHVLPPISG
jgi:hypothetical protein